MAWVSVSALVCSPSLTPDTSGYCPEGKALTLQTLYAPTSDPSVPSAEYAEYTAVSFSIVMAVWLISKLLGRLISFVQRV